MVDKWIARQEKIQNDTQKSLNEYATLINNYVTACVTLAQRGKKEQEFVKQNMTEWYVDHLESMDAFYKEWKELIEKQAQ